MPGKSGLKQSGWVASIQDMHLDSAFVNLQFALLDDRDNNTTI